MKRADFTVITKTDTRYSANHLSITHVAIIDGLISMLNFISSGEMISIPAKDIKKIEFDSANAVWCSECDQSIQNVVGQGIHK